VTASGPPAGGDNVILRARLGAIRGPRCDRTSDSPAQVTDSGADPTTDSDVPTSLADAEEEVSRAEARAEAARARATQLRQRAEADSSDPSDRIEDAETADGDVDEIEPAPARTRRWRAPRFRPPARKTVGIGAGVILACASLAASGYMVRQDRIVTHKRQLAPEFAAAARLGVTALMSINPNHAKDDVQRSIDASTGDLKTQLEARSAIMVQRAEEAKVTSKVTVEAVGVESVTDNSGVALVSAKSDVTDPDNSKRPPMLWRISVQIERDGGQLKVSRIDFLQ
jgi:Mce-associated membrane protein